VRTLNLGILAHVDAGKTSLTERLLFAAGVLETVGRVDDGSTLTDSLALERQRGITIKSAVASFVAADVAINLIDTPGHPDFIAEVERALAVLDGAVLVVSAVEGVQAQTRILMRALRRLGIPTLIFINKIDRTGADPETVLRDIRAKLHPAAIAMGAAEELGTSAASWRPYGAGDAAFGTELLDQLASNDDVLVGAYVHHGLGHDRLVRELAAQTARGVVCPVFAGSAITGAGIEALMAGLTGLLPAATGRPDGPSSGVVFKVERGPGGEKVAYVRMRTGAIRLRDRVRFGAGHAAKVTAISVFTRGAAEAGDTVRAGQIARLSGLAQIQIGDTLGSAPRTAAAPQFAPPTLETVIAPRRPGDRGALHAALVQLAEQDPLINVRRDDERQELSLSLYGEVQKEVIQATLAGDYGLEVSFRETTTVCVEEVVGAGEAVMPIDQEVSPFLAGIGLRIEPADGGISFRLEVELGAMPFAFFKAVEETARTTLGQGLSGWAVNDCAVTITYCDYWARQSHAHATFDKSMSSTAGDFRLQTPLVLMAALRQAGTRVLEPMHRIRLELPGDTLRPVLASVSRLGGVPYSSTANGPVYHVDGEVPAARVHELRQHLPGLTRGEGVLESEFHRYAPVRGTPPIRPRSDHNPLDRKEYLLHVVRRV